MGSNLREQLRNLLPFSAVLYAPALALLLAAAVVARTTPNIALSQLTRDAAAVAHSQPWYGALSNIGALIWAAAGTICFFTAILIWSRGVRKDVVYFFIFGGLLTTLLLLDDFFMFHEWFFRRYFDVRQRFTFSVYALLLVAYLVRYRRTILASDYALLALAFLFFASSLAVDRVPEGRIPYHYLFEDYPKFLGIVSWFGYYARTGYVELQRRAPPAGKDQP